MQGGNISTVVKEVNSVTKCNTMHIMQKLQLEAVTVITGLITITWEEDWPEHPARIAPYWHACPLRQKVIDNEGRKWLP